MPIRHTAVQFFGLGSQTAAPLLYSYVREHPALLLPESETNFFTQSEVWAQGLAWYESQFGAAKPGQIRGELSLLYLRHAPAAGLIARSYPNAKLLAVVENPLVSVKVAYIEAKRAGEIDARLSFKDYCNRYPEVLQQACYGRQLLPYFSYYATTDLLVLTASEVRANPLQVLNNVFTLIGVDPKFVPLALRHLVVEEEDDSKRRPGLITRTFRFIKKQITHFYGFLHRIIKPPVVPIETAAAAALALRVEPEIEAKLKQYFIKDVERLENLLRRPLKADWGF